MQAPGTGQTDATVGRPTLSTPPGVTTYATPASLRSRPANLLQDGIGAEVRVGDQDFLPVDGPGCGRVTGTLCPLRVTEHFSLLFRAVVRVGGACPLAPRRRPQPRTLPGSRTGLPPRSTRVVPSGRHRRCQPGHLQLAGQLTQHRQLGPEPPHQRSSVRSSRRPLVWRRRRGRRFCSRRSRARL